MGPGEDSATVGRRVLGTGSSPPFCSVYLCLCAMNGSSVEVRGQMARIGASFYHGVLGIEPPGFLASQVEEQCKIHLLSFVLGSKLTVLDTHYSMDGL